MSKDKLEKIVNSINEKLALHGGGVELVAWDEEKKILKLRLQGACSHCPMAQMTSENFIKKELLKEVPELKEIEVVG